MTALLQGLRIVQTGSGAASFAGWALAELGAEVMLVPQREAPGNGSWLDAGKRRWKGRLARALDGADGWLCGSAGGEPTAGPDMIPAAGARQGLPVVFTSTFGCRGPYAGWLGDDLCAQAVSGLLSTLGAAGRPPLPLPFEQGDYLAGICAAAALLGMIVGPGEPGVRDVATADVLAFATGVAASAQGYDPHRFRRGGVPLNRNIYPTGVYPCRDGHVLLASNNDRQWKRLAALAGVPAGGEPTERDARRRWRDGFLAPFLASLRRRELLDLALREELTLAPVNHVAELAEEPHLRERRFFLATAEGPRPRAPFLVDGRRPSPAPKLSPGSVARPPLPRVLDLSWNWAGALAGQMLAESGAEIIRVESRARLENLRAHPALALAFRHANRGKLGVTVNLRSEAGRAIFLSLLSRCDVLMESFSPGTLDRLGLGEAQLRRARPGLIILSSTAAGATGPWRPLHGFAAITHAIGGLEALVRYPGEPPGGHTMMSGHADLVAAAWGCLAVLSALRHRSATGDGVTIDLSQIEALAAGLGTALIEKPGSSAASRSDAAGRIRHTGGGRWIVVQENTPDVGRGDPALIAQTLQARGIAAAPVHDIAGQQRDAHLRARGVIEAASHPAWGDALLYRPVWLRPPSSPPDRRDAPGLGEHNGQVLGDLLGIGDPELSRLTEEEAVF